MLRITLSVYRELEQTFLSDEHEQGFILGSKECLNEIGCCKLLPATQSGDYYYVPDNHFADITIRNWAEENICFTGFIHSHTKGQMYFSDDDILFANKLLDSYRIPFLWFGLAVITGENDVCMMFYRINKENGKVILKPEATRII